MNAHEQKHADAQRWHYEMAIAWRIKYHHEKRECKHNAAEQCRRDFEYHNRIIGNALNIEQAA